MSQPAPPDATDPWFQDRFAQRIGGAGFGKGNEIYKFELIKRAKRKAIADHPERRMLDFGIGENDEMAPPDVRAVMKREVDRPENRGYADNGIAAFKQAAAAFMQREFGVTLDAEKEVNHCIGSKTAYAMLPAAFIDPGDVTLMTVPGYPVAGTATRWFGGVVHRLPLLPENGFFPDLDGIPADVLSRAKMLVLCYPNSPTGRTATRDFYRRVIEFAHRHRIVVVQDAAHIMLSYDDQPLSFLSVDGAKEVGVEVHSMSKGFHMIGWRLGWVCGHERIVRAFADVKDNCDSGQFMAIQKAGGAGRPGNPAARPGEIPAPAGETGGGAAGFGLRLRDARWHLLPVHEEPQGRRRPRLRHGAGGQPVPDPRPVDLHSPLGRLRRLSEVLGDLRSR
jgi:LL-diaminopimelate aminotransferase